MNTEQLSRYIQDTIQHSVAPTTAKFLSSFRVDGTQFLKFGDQEILVLSDGNSEMIDFLLSASNFQDWKKFSHQTQRVKARPLLPTPAIQSVIDHHYSASSPLLDPEWQSSRSPSPTSETPPSADSEERNDQESIHAMEVNATDASMLHDQAPSSPSWSHSSTCSSNLFLDSTSFNDQTQPEEDGTSSDVEDNSSEPSEDRGDPVQDPVDSSLTSNIDSSPVEHENQQAEFNQTESAFVQPLNVDLSDLNEPSGADDDEEGEGAEKLVDLDSTVEFSPKVDSDIDASDEGDQPQYDATQIEPEDQDESGEDSEEEEENMDEGSREEELWENLVQPDVDVDAFPEHEASHDTGLSPQSVVNDPGSFIEETVSLINLDAGTLQSGEQEELVELAKEVESGDDGFSDRLEDENGDEPDAAGELAPQTDEFEPLSPINLPSEASHPASPISQLVSFDLEMLPSPTQGHSVDSAVEVAVDNHSRMSSDDWEDLSHASREDENLPHLTKLNLDLRPRFSDDESQSSQSSESLHSPMFQSTEAPPQLSLSVDWAQSPEFPRYLLADHSQDTDGLPRKSLRSPHRPDLANFDTNIQFFPATSGERALPRPSAKGPKKRPVGIMTDEALRDTRQIEDLKQRVRELQSLNKSLSTELNQLKKKSIWTRFIPNITLNAETSDDSFHRYENWLRP
ncbi:hypothetical protein C8J56DRAFT_1060117 [Mycena floridula]|nr:hypothetical protein C8J56DRAFT_1060117 [Mycena floridula]